MPKRTKRYHKRERKNLELRAWVMAQGITYKDIAKKIYISQSTLSQWFQSDMQPWQREEVIQAVKEIVIERGNRDEEVRNRESRLWSDLVSSMACFLDNDTDTHIEDRL